MRGVISFIIAFICAGWSYAAKNEIVYDHCIPENGSEISSFDNITLIFDISKIQQAYPQYDQLGICSTAIEDFDPEWANAIILYKGDPSDGNILASLYETRTVDSENFAVGNEFSFGFNSIPIEDNQEYTVKIFYSFDVGQKGLSSSELSTLTKESVLNLDYYNSIDLTFLGKTESDKISITDIVPETNSTLGDLNEIRLSFNTPISISDDVTVTFFDNDVEVPYNTNITLISDTEVSIDFENINLKKTHTYKINIREGSFLSDIGESPDYDLIYFGDSWNYFSLKRGVYPIDGSEVIEIGNVNIPFNFPEGYGFKTTSSGPVEINADLYVGGLDGEKIDSYVFEASDADATILVGSVSTPLDAGQSYTLIVPKEQVVARNLTGIGSIEGWTNDDVVINLTTPSADAINAVEINGEIPSQAESIDNVTLSVSPYKYKDDNYNYVVCEEPVIKLFENDSEIASYPIELAMVENAYVLRNKEAMNAELAKGKSYRIVLPAGTVTPDHSFLGKYAANKELTFTIEGMATGELKAEFTSNIAEGQTASHIGVVSIYTANPVAAVEGAALELRNGEEVKTAPVRVSVENGYSHIYADFSDADHKALALERATEYTVVLPQGSVTDASNESLINNEYSFTVNGLEKEAEPIVPEYVSVDFTIDQYVSTSYRMVKGEPSTIKVNATDEWYLKSLTLNGEDVIENVSEEGFYTLPALEADAELTAEFSYFEDLEMTETTGVGTIDGSNGTISVYNDGGVIVIENLMAGDNVAVYTVNGMVIKSFVASKDIMYIDAPMGQVYIIRVNNAAVKLQH